MIDIPKTREELEELGCALQHIANLGTLYLSVKGAEYWQKKTELILGLADVLETLGTEDLTLTNLQAAAERALRP